MELEPFGQEYTIEKKEEEFTQDKVLLLRDSEGNISARHCMYSVPKENVLNFFENSTDRLNKFRDYPVYGGYIESFERGKGIGMTMWEYGETNFYNEQSSSYLRFVFDSDTENKWTTRHINKLVETLNSKGIPVVKLAEKDWAKKFMGILLFQK